MAKAKSTKLTVEYRGGKLQFGVHDPTGQHRKKIKGHMLYLGSDPEGVMNQWLEKTDLIDADLDATAAVEVTEVTVKQRFDLFLSGKERQVDTGEIAQATFRGYRQHGKLMAKFFGRSTQIAELTPNVFASFKAHLARTKPQKKNGKTGEGNQTVALSLLGYFKRW